MVGILFVVFTQRTGATNRLRYGTKIGRLVVRDFFGFVTSQDKNGFFVASTLRQVVLWPPIALFSMWTGSILLVALFTSGPCPVEIVVKQV